MFIYEIIRNNPELINNYKSREKIPLICVCCGKSYAMSKHQIQAKMLKNMNNFCSLLCKSNFYNGPQQNISCTNCNKLFYRNTGQTKRSKNQFCSRSCSATYNNKNKSSGTRRSKLEIWLEEQLTISYPNLEIHFNRKDAIGSELDIYFPSLRLAIELNGIYHYEPIHGLHKLNKIQANDTNKFQKCQENNISLCIIDTSNHKYVTPKSSKKYLDIINELVGGCML